MALTYTLSDDTTLTGASVQIGESKDITVKVGDTISFRILEATPNMPISLQRSLDNGATWVTVTTGQTDELGKFNYLNVPITDLPVDRMPTRVVVG